MRRRLRFVVVVCAAVIASLLLQPHAAVASEGTPGAPLDVVAIAGDSTAFVRWSAPVGDVGVDHYRVTVYLGDEVVAVRKVVGALRGTTVVGLTNGVAYTFEVVAEGTAGDGPSSARSAVIVPGRGGPLSNLSAEISLPGSHSVTDVAVSPDGSLAYAAAFDAVWVVDAARDLVLDSIPIAGVAASIAVSPDGARLYVTDTFNDLVITIDAASGEVIRTVSAGGNPTDIAVSADGALLYVLDSFYSPSSPNGSLLILDALADRAYPSVTVGVQPTGMTVASDGRIFVASHSTITVVNLKSLLWVDAVFSVDQASGVAVSPDGSRVYVTTDNDGLLIFDTETHSQVASVDLGWSGSGVAASPDGDVLYVAGPYRVSMVSTATDAVLSTTLLETLWGDVVISPTGAKAYVTGGSQLSVLTPPAPPSEPRNVWAIPGDEPVQLGWSAPSDGGVSLTGYRIEYSADEGENWFDVLVDGEVEWAVVPDLSNGIEYLFRVSAINLVGTGLPSLPVRATPATLPRPPEDVVATAGAGYATMRWSAPLSDGGSAVTGYEVAYRPVGTTQWLAGPEVPASTRDATVGGLTAGAGYQLRVAARNDLGLGAWSATATVTIPGTSFFDVPASNQFYDEIMWLASSGVTTGYSDGGFRPLGTVNRDAMAAFLYRYAGSPAFVPPSTSPFSDVATSSQFYREITWLASTGITTGYPDGSFRPLGTVNRDAMAAFLFRFAQSPSWWTAPATSPFTDVPTSNQFYKEITWLAYQGISTGYTDGTFRPLGTVNRDAMAAFLYRFPAGLIAEAE